MQVIFFLLTRNPGSVNSQNSAGLISKGIRGTKTRSDQQSFLSASCFDIQVAELLSIYRHYMRDTCRLSKQVPKMNPIIKSTRKYWINYQINVELVLLRVYLIIFKFSARNMLHVRRLASWNCKQENSSGRKQKLKIAYVCLYVS